MRPKTAGESSYVHFCMVLGYTAQRMVNFAQFGRAGKPTMGGQFQPKSVLLAIKKRTTSNLRGDMPQTVQVGSILMKEWPGMKQIFGLDSEPCSGEWSLIEALDGFALDRKIHAAGWNFFFMAAEVKVMFFGSLGAANGTAKIRSALKRILEKVRPQQFNGLEVTQIVARRFLGVPYVTVSAHSRHIQQSCYLDSATARQAVQRSAEWARG
jgi:hypothetical protein